MKKPSLIKFPGKNWGVHGDLSPEEVRKLLSMDHLLPFLQGNTPEWKFVEFWNTDQDEILESVMKLFPNIELD